MMVTFIFHTKRLLFHDSTERIQETQRHYGTPHTTPFGPETLVLLGVDGTLRQTMVVSDGLNQDRGFGECDSWRTHPLSTNPTRKGSHWMEEVPLQIRRARLHHTDKDCGLWHHIHQQCESITTISTRIYTIESQKDSFVKIPMKGEEEFTPYRLV